MSLPSEDAYFHRRAYVEICIRICGMRWLKLMKGVSNEPSLGSTDGELAGQRSCKVGLTYVDNPVEQRAYEVAYTLVKHSV